MLPLILVNVFWFYSSRNQLISASSVEVSRVSTLAANQIQNFLLTKQISLVVHSQTETVLNFDLPGITAELQRFLLQDSDINDLVFMDNFGHELVKVDRSKVYPPDQLTDQSQSTTYKVTTYVGGERYISPVYPDAQGLPSIDIAVPIVLPQTPQSLDDLSTSAIGKSRSVGEIRGVLKENVNLSRLWALLSRFNVDQTGYVYIVDDKGNLIMHPDTQLLGQHKNLQGVAEVDAYLASTQYPGASQPTHQSVNEQGVVSLTSHTVIPQSHWAAISQVPLDEIFKTSNQILIFALALFFIVMIFVILTGLWLSRRITIPIHQLRYGSRVIGSGDLQYRLHIHSGDEIEELGNSFNHMADSLQKSFLNLIHEKNLIHAERNKLEVIISGISDGVIAIDQNHCVIMFNPAAEKITNIKTSDIIGQQIDQVLKFYDGANQVSSTIYCPLTPETASGVLFSRSELQLQSGSNQGIYVSLISGQIREGAKINLGCILTLHDVSKEKQFDEMKLDFVSIAAHELRTPLTAIRGYSELLLEDADKINLTPEYREQLSRISSSSEQLSSLIDNLLSVSRIERNAFNVDTKPTDLVELVQSSLPGFQEQAKTKKQHLTFQNPISSIPLVQADSVRINQVLGNLLINAINYTKPGGNIKITVQTKGNFVTVSVQDTGPGIPPESIPKLFTKFYRVSGVLEQGSKGTGLGLYISKSIIELHHGDIWVDSVVGQGSTFTFSLPIIVQVSGDSRPGGNLSESHPHGILINQERSENP